MKQLRGVILLFLIFVGCVPFLSVPGQLYDVYMASGASTLEVEYVTFSIYTVRVGSKNNNNNNNGPECRYIFKFKNLKNGEIIEVTDAIPGDFWDCRNAKKLAKVYSEGEITKIYMAPDEYYFLKQGSALRATLPLVISLLVFMILYRIAKKNTV